MKKAFNDKKHPGFEKQEEANSVFAERKQWIAGEKKKGSIPKGRTINKKKKGV